VKVLRLRPVPSLGATLLAAVATGNVALWLVARPVVPKIPFPCRSGISS
jgi:hypothetical protein